MWFAIPSRMEESIWLLAALCSREVFVPLSTFAKAQSLLRNGIPFLDSEFLKHCPELQIFRIKYSNSDLEKIQTELFKSVEKGNLLLYPGHPFFPSSYLTLEEVPFLLRMKGSPIWMALPGVSVVGHREPSRSSLQWMEEHLAELFRTRDCFSVSGGARGVDQKAHLISLRTGKPTVVLLPSGLEQIYPSSLQPWVQDVVSSGGALLSEYEDHRKMQKHYFAQRNRLISGLGLVTLIIEARRRSGTLLTAQEAIEQGKPIWILPGHPMDPGFHGSLDLMRDCGNNTLVRDAWDLCLFFDSEIKVAKAQGLDPAKYLVEPSKAQH